MKEQGKDNAAASRPTATRTTDAPGRRTLVQSRYRGVQCKAAGHAAGTREPGDAFATAVSGAGSPVPYRAEMEAAFGAGFGDVRAHLGGGEAQSGLRDLGAKAAAHGDQIAFRDAAPDRGLVAHELAHVVQQRRGGGGVQRKPSRVSASTDDAERLADAAADAALRGTPMPDVGAAPADSIHRAEDTHGGEWDTDWYEVRPDNRGVRIKLTFTPNELVECPSIGLTQTANSQKGSAADPAVNEPYYLGDADRRAEVEGRSLTSAEEGGGPGGRHIDRASERINPMYGANNPTDAAGAVDDSAALDDSAQGGNTHWGHRTARADGTFDVDDAWLTDAPSLSTSAGQTSAQTFETTALCLDGDMQGTYLGSVSWGYDKDATGAVNVHPLGVVSMGVPSSAWRAAAGKWNESTTDVAGADTDNLDLPIPDHTTADPASLSDVELERRMRTLHEQLRGMTEDDDPVTYRNIRFEIRGLGREAVNRATRVEDSGHTLTVAAGDTLWGLASEHLGSGALWVQIFALNAADMSHGDILAAGATLKMPRPYDPAAE